MKTPKDDFLSPEEILNLENEMRSLNLEINYGAKSFTSDKLTPDQKKKWFDLVEKREEEYQAADTIAIYEFIGKPEFVAAADISTDDLDNAIQEIEILLEENKIVIEKPEFLHAPTWYEFLTTDLFEHQITNYRASTIFHALDYDNFRHDGPDFVAMHAQDAIEDIIDLKNDYEGIWLTDPCRSGEKMVAQSAIMKKVQAFRLNYKEIIPLGFSAMDARKVGPSMFFTFGVAWDGILAKNGETMHQEGLGICQLAWEEGEWMVQGIEMPGFAF